MLPVGAVASRRGRAPEAVRLVQAEPAHVPVVALVGNRRLAAAAVVVEGGRGAPGGSVRARARAPRGGSNPPRAGASSAPFPLARRGRTARDRRAANASAREGSRARRRGFAAVPRARRRREKRRPDSDRRRAPLSPRGARPSCPRRPRLVGCIWRTLERHWGMPLCICAVAGVARFTGTNGAGASPSRNGCRCSSVGGASDLRRVGTANSMLSPRTGPRSSERPGRRRTRRLRERATGSLGSARVQGVAMASRIAEMAHSARNEVGGGIGARMGDVLAPSPVESDMMLAATCGAAWWAGFTPRGIPIGRVVGCLAQIGGAPFTLFAWKIFGSGAIPTSAASSRNQKPVRGFES